MALSQNPVGAASLLVLLLFSLIYTVHADILHPATGFEDTLLSPLELKVRAPTIDDALINIQGFPSDGDAPPHTFNHEKRYGSGAPYWMSQIKRQGKIAYGNNASYILWRNVRDYGAKGDGVTDDTDAINNATADGNRCGYGCDSQTTTPAIIYFPPGTYIVSAPLILYYYTQVIGDANNLPTLIATPDFYGIGIFDSNKYLPYGYNWFQNQNNFYRQIRNFVLDITQVPPTRAVHCVHWQVAQATSLQNLVMNMAVGTVGDGSQQMGIFMDNGSGGLLEDLIFNGGGVGFLAGNQQFTCLNLTFNNCETAIFQNWNWLFLYKSIFINNCAIGVDLSQGGDIPAVGSQIIQDSIFTNVNFGIITTFSANSTPVSAGTLVLDNVDFVRTNPAVQYPNGTVILPGNQRVASFLQGRVYSAYESMETINNLTCYLPAANDARVQQVAAPPPKSPSLLDPAGNIWERSRPQYEGVLVTAFKSIIDYGCIGDGLQDDTACLQNFLNSINTATEIAYFDHGAYLIRNTIQIPNNIRIQGEIWPLIMIDGTSPVWQDQNNPVPAIRVGHPGETGTTEIVELVFETRGSAPGCIIVEWNLAGANGPTSTGMWDTHWRIGGTNGTLLQSDHCTKQPTLQHAANQTCIGAFLLLHLTYTSQMVMSNNWGWVSDHELDLGDHNQIDIYNGRGILIESQGPIMAYGTSFEHSMLYNYNVANAKDIYMGIIQSETAYMQDNPNALDPFTPQTTWSDPSFSECYSPNCYKTFGLRIFNSTYIFNYGAGLYSFFNNYDSGCLITGSCQQLMVSLEQSEAVYLFGLSTKAAFNMVEVDDVALVPQAANANGFCESVAVFEYP